jgi:hypothetical protein
MRIRIGWFLFSLASGHACKLIRTACEHGSVRRSAPHPIGVKLRNTRIVPEAHQIMGSKDFL